MRRKLTSDDVLAAVKGGSIYACGGGGWADHGMMLGTAAVMAGQPELVSIDELDPDAWIATAAAIGAPGESTAWQMLGVDYVRAVRLVEEWLGAPLAGLIIGQNGMSSTLNAWLPSAILGLSVIDAVGDVRAHPTGDMGSIGLAGSPQPMIQAAAGGNRSMNAYIELLVKGATARVSPVLRTAADMAGGFIASCRNPVPASYVKDHAALGGISMAIELGNTILAAEGQGGDSVRGAICEATGGRILASGTVTAKNIAYAREAFDIGTITLATASGDVTIHVMNEHMAVDAANGDRIATYPDVITTLDRGGAPVSAGRIAEEMEIHILHVPYRLLPLSASVSDPAVYPPVEEALKLSIAAYGPIGR